MWKASTDVNAPAPAEADDWDTDPDFVNDVSEQEQRWGPGGRHVEAIDMAKLREEVLENDRISKKKEYEEGPKPSFGYGGKFGVQKDRMDKCAMGHEYVGKVEKHVSQTDYAQGFGGRFGVQTDRVDKSAAGWEHKEQVEKHPSQKDYSVGFGGKFGVQTDRKDASALGWEHREKPQQHHSQKDYAIGFGGKFGVQKDRQDASALGWDHVEKTPPHASQTDHKEGFGGFVLTSSTPPKVPDVKPAVKVASMRTRFENISDEKNEGSRKTVQAIRLQKVMETELPDKEKEKSNSGSQVQGPTHISLVGAENLPRPMGKVDTGRFQTKTEPSSPAAQNKKEPLAKMLHQTPNKVPPTMVPCGSESPLQMPKMPQTKAPRSPESPLQMPNIVPPTMIPCSPESPLQTPNMPMTVESSPEPLFEGDAAQKLGPTDDVPKKTPTVVVSPVGWDTESSETDDEDAGYTARALYDYQAAASDEISFDPDDLITNIVMVDEGWWQGLCKGAFGLFPANYVQLQDNDQQ